MTAKRVTQRSVREQAARYVHDAIGRFGLVATTGEIQDAIDRIEAALSEIPDMKKAIAPVAKRRGRPPRRATPSAHPSAPTSELGAPEAAPDAPARPAVDPHER